MTDLIEHLYAYPIITVVDIHVAQRYMLPEGRPDTQFSISLFSSEV